MERNANFFSATTSVFYKILQKNTEPVKQAYLEKLLLG
jgi:hypothetical protein